MEKNKDILNEAFFGKSKLFMSKKNAEKLNKKLPQYTPITSDKLSNSGLLSVMDIDSKKGKIPGITFDTKEVKKRLTGAMGAVFGINNVKSLANRSVKKFPIILSDDIEPETAVSLKRLMEEQYAEYINLLISNQILDISEFTTDKTGNIAIQALDRITGADEKVSLGNKAMSGELEVEDVITSMVPVFGMLREDKEFRSGNEALDYFLENAVVFDNNESAINFAKQLTEAFSQGDIFSLGLSHREIDSSGYDQFRYIYDSNSVFKNDKVLGEYLNMISPRIISTPSGEDYILSGFSLDDRLYLNTFNFKTPEEKEFYGYIDASENKFYMKATYNQKIRERNYSSESKAVLETYINSNKNILNNKFIPSLVVVPNNQKVIYEIYANQSDMNKIYDDIDNRFYVSGNDNTMTKFAEKHDITLIKVTDKFKDRSLIGITGNETSYPDEKKYPSVMLYEAGVGYVNEKNSKIKTNDKEVEKIVDAFKENTKKISPSIQGNKFSVRSLANEDALIDSLDVTIGELINNEDNKVIKDKFSKAQLLLVGNRITGKEFIEYTTVRLGMPIPERVRREILLKFPISKLDAFNLQEKSGNKYILNKETKERIEKGQHLFYDSLYDQMFKPTMKEVLSKIIKVGSISAGAGLAGGVGAALVLPATLAAAPIFSPIAAVVFGTTAAIIAAKKIFTKKSVAPHSNIRGWERVEALIAELDKQRNEVIKVETQKQDVSGSITGVDGKPLEVPLDSYERSLRSYEKLIDARTKSDEEIPLTQDDIDKILKTFSKEIEKHKGRGSKALNASVEVEDELYVHILNEEELVEINEILNEATAEASIQEEDETDMFISNLLREAVIETNIPSKVYKYEVKHDDKSKVMIAPAFTARSAYAYGSTEYDRRENKDRKYNQPLILTVTFKERFADGKFSDNELTAVIGVLGVITRVPAEEMEYVLKTSAEGTTIKGVFQGDGSPTNLVTDLFKNSKINQNIKNLPVSSDIWKSLEDVKIKAIANSMSGKKTDNVANAHIVFSQKEIDSVRAAEGHDYIKNRALPSKLMDRYSAFTIMIANDLNERLYIFDDPNRASWDVVPYSAIRGKDSGDQLTSALSKLSRGF